MLFFSKVMRDLRGFYDSKDTCDCKPGFGIISGFSQSIPWTGAVCIHGLVESLGSEHNTCISVCIWPWFSVEFRIHARYLDKFFVFKVWGVGPVSVWLFVCEDWLVYRFEIAECFLCPWHDICWVNGRRLVWLLWLGLMVTIVFRVCYWLVKTLLFLSRSCLFNTWYQSIPGGDKFFHQTFSIVFQEFSCMELIFYRLIA